MIVNRCDFLIFFYRDFRSFENSRSFQLFVRIYDSNFSRLIALCLLCTYLRGERGRRNRCTPSPCMMIIYCKEKLLNLRIKSIGGSGIFLKNKKKTYSLPQTQSLDTCLSVFVTEYCSGISQNIYISWTFMLHRGNERTMSHGTIEGKPGIKIGSRKTSVIGQYFIVQTKYDAQKYESSLNLHRNRWLTSPWPPWPFCYQFQVI